MSIKSDLKALALCTRGDGARISDDVIRKWLEEVTRMEASVAELDLIKPSAEVLQEGFWRSCSGCHESNEGHPTGPHSATFNCHLGSGCHE